MENTIKTLIKHFKNILIKIWYARSKFSWTNFAIRCKLPYGGRFLAYGDCTGLEVILSNINIKSFENKDWNFVKRYLKKGMTVIDVGANQGFYTILCSFCIGENGIVYAFEC